MNRNHTTTGTTWLVSDQYTYLPGRRIVPSPADTWDMGLTGLTLRISQALSDRGADEGVLLLDAHSVHRAGLPVTLGDAEGDTDHQALKELREAGWKAATLRPWIVLHAQGRPNLYVGFLPWINRANCPIITSDYASTVEAVQRWHCLLGTAFHATPGVSGISTVRAVATAGKRDRSPTWQPKQRGPEGAYELDYKLPNRDGSRPAFSRAIGEIPEEHHYIHGYDSKRAYLGAFNSVLVSPWTLRNKGEDYSPDLAGWWLIELEEWTNELLPDPAGYPSGWEADGPKWAQDVGRNARWVTTPTMALLTQLQGDGEHPGFTVHDSWTGPARRVLRPVGELFRDVWQDPTTQVDPSSPDLTVNAALQTSFKALYRETWGMLGSEKSRVTRPDWHFSILAQFRANLWRRLKAVGEKSGRWPVSIDTDNVFYSSAEADPFKAAPEGLPIGETLGKFWPKKTKEINRG